MRNFLPLAIAQNHRQWAKQADVFSGPVSATFLNRLEQEAHWRQARFLALRRHCIEAAIAECVEHPRLFWNHRYFRALRGSCVASTDEAVVEIKSAIAAEKARKGHWSHKPERLAELGDALVFARWFRRNSRKAWSRAAA